MASVFIRFIVLVGILLFGALTSEPARELIIKVFEYQNPSNLFGASWAEWSLAWVISSVFWAGIVFGALGTKLDYIFMALVGLFAIWEFTGTANVTPEMYLALTATAIISNLIGYGLKVARLHWKK